MVTTWQELSEAIATHAARAAEKLRAEDATAGQVSVFLQTNQFRKDLPQRHCSGSRELLSHTSSTRIILSEAIAIGQSLWRDGFRYKKAGVMLSDICHDHPQRSLFEPRDLNRDCKLMRTMDAINARMGERSLHPASMGLRRRNWHMRRKQQSPRYTTRWDELPKVISDIRGMRPRH
jgi:DNA polymerase V